MKMMKRLATGQVLKVVFILKFLFSMSFTVVEWLSQHHVMFEKENESSYFQHLKVCLNFISFSYSIKFPTVPQHIMQHAEKGEKKKVS